MHKRFMAHGRIKELSVKTLLFIVAKTGNMVLKDEV